MLIAIHNALKGLAGRLWVWRHRKRLAALQNLFMPEIIEDGKLIARTPSGPNGEMVSVDLTAKVMEQTRQRARSDAMKLAINYLREHPELEFKPLASDRPLRAQPGIKVDLPAMIRNTSLQNLSRAQLEEKFKQQVEQAVAAGQQPPIAPVP